MRAGKIINGVVVSIAENMDTLPVNCVKITDGMTVNIGDMYEDGAFRTPTLADTNRIHRPAFNAARDRLFAETAWIRQRHADRVELMADDAANWTAWLTYWQTLRDMTAAPDFDAANPTWPEQPE